MQFGARFGKWVLPIFACLAFSISGVAQVTTADKYLITAKAGGVNLVEGEVSVLRTNGRSGLLVKGDEVQVGERVTTGSDGRAEILMNPGSYVRLGTNSSFEFVSSDLDDVRLKVHKGSAILEMFGTEGFQIDLSTDTARFTLLETGVYRIDAAPGGTSTVAVWKGKLRAGLDSTESVGKGKIVTFDGKAYSVIKFDRDDQDALAVWSRDRSKELSKISSTLRPDRLRDPLINSFYGGRWDLYNSFGLWVYNPLYRSFCFLPFGYGWSSPYGFGFGRSIWYYNLPVAIYNQPEPPRSSGKVSPRRSLSEEPVRRVSPARGTGDSIERKRTPVRDSIRDSIRNTIPQGQPVEPRISMPRIEPVIVTPPPSAPNKATRGH